MQVSWIDAAQLSALADSLRPQSSSTREPEPPESYPVEAVEISEPVDDKAEVEAMPPLHEQPIDEIRSKLKAIREKAIRAGLIRSEIPAAEPEIPAAEPELVDQLHEPESSAESLTGTTLLTAMPEAYGDVHQRISLFADWAQPALKGSDLFIVDDQGQLLWGPPLRSSIVLSAIMAHMATARMSAQTACETEVATMQTLASGSHLILQPCATRLGIMHIAILGSAVIEPTHLLKLSQTLIQAMDL